MKIRDIIDSYYIKPEYLSAYRILYGLIVMIFIGLPAYSWLGNSIDYLFKPPTISISNLFNGFPGSGFFNVLTFLNLVFFICMFLGIQSKWSSLLFSLTCIIGYNYWYSFGKVDHLLLWVITPMFLGFAGWGNHFNIYSLLGNRKSKEAELVSRDTISLIISLLALSIAFSMLTSGVAKVMGGWLSWSHEAVRYNLIKNYFTLDRAEFMASYFLTFKNHLVWKAMDYSALFLECGFILSVVRQKYFRIFLLMAVAFHVLVLVMFNIAFYSNLIAYMLFIDWSLIDRRFGILKLAHNPVKSKVAIQFFSLTALCFGFWCLYCLLKGSLFFQFPGLIEECLSLLSVSDAYHIAILSLFSITLFVLVYMMICHFIQFNKQRKSFE